MDEEQHPVAATEDQRDLVRIATGILMERYDVPGLTSESALMDWSRITGIDVYALATLVIDDVSRT